MDGRADDNRTDFCSRVIDMGVQIKNPLSSSSWPSAAQRRECSKDLNHQTPHEAVDLKGEKLPCRCTENGQNQAGVPCRDRAQMVVVAAVLVTLLFSACSFLYLLNLSDVRTSEIQDLKQRLHRLDELCGVTTTGKLAQAQRVTDSASNGSPPQPHGLPWQQNANRPGTGVSAVQEEDSFHEYVENGQNAYDDDDEEEDEDHGDLYYDLLFDKSRQKRSSRTRRARNGKSKTCKRLENCIKDKKKGKTIKKKCARMLKCLPPPPAPKSPMPVHFTSKFLVEERQKNFGKEAPLRLTEEAHWMRHLYPNKSQQPLVPLKDGGYTVNLSGAYFVYTSVMFHDLKPRQSQAVVVNGEKRFKCMDSVDSLQGPHKYKTCAISGVTYLKAGDRLEVQNLYGQTEIDQTQDATYFGAILLFPFEIKGR